MLWISTTTRHNYSRWRHPGNLKAKRSILKFILFEYKDFHFKILNNFNCKHYVLRFDLKLFLVLVEFPFRGPVVSSC